MNNKIIELANNIVSYSHINCEMWEEEHKTDLQALDNSHESYFIEFLQEGIRDKEFTEKQYYKAFNLAYDLVNKGE
jgi:hypothetical protein